MATFITTLRFTDKGIAGIKDTCKRAAAFHKSAKKMNIKVHDVYWTLGTYDGVLIFEAPDDATATAAMLNLGAGDNVHTSTVRAFTAAEMEKIVAKL